jgi:hypothetical protein
MNLRALSALAIGLLLVGSACAQGWGNIKGQVVWGKPVIPGPVNLVANTPPANIPPCVMGGVLLSDELIINPKSKGVANVMVWIAALEDADLKERTPKPIPIHPDLKAVPNDTVVIDQPCCLFTPRVVMVREGQPLEIHNSAAFNHSFKYDGDSQRSGSKNFVIAAGGKALVELKAEKKPIPINCTLHGWMGGRIGVFNHPYFVLTDKDGNFEIKNAPAGKFLLYIFHETPGWVHKGGSKGQEIEIKKGETLDLGKFQMK